MDDPNVAAPGYGIGEQVWEGLGLVPFTILPITSLFTRKRDWPRKLSIGRLSAASSTKCYETATY